MGRKSKVEHTTKNSPLNFILFKIRNQEVSKSSSSPKRNVPECYYLSTTSCQGCSLYCITLLDFNCLVTKQCLNTYFTAVEHELDRKLTSTDLLFHCYNPNVHIPEWLLQSFMHSLSFYLSVSHSINTKWFTLQHQSFIKL